ncbi:hypothetical protein a10_06337 [Streptomyces acidiscabies]|nr:hypothetical protein a10_06337 [Streptomyces acidiscabies]
MAGARWTGGRWRRTVRARSVDRGCRRTHAHAPRRRQAAGGRRQAAGGRRQYSLAPPRPPRACRSGVSAPTATSLGAPPPVCVPTSGRRLGPPRPSRTALARVPTRTHPPDAHSPEPGPTRTPTCRHAPVRQVEQHPTALCSAALPAWPTAPRGTPGPLPSGKARCLSGGASPGGPATPGEAPGRIRTRLYARTRRATPHRPAAPPHPPLRRSRPALPPHRAPPRPAVPRASPTAPPHHTAYLPIPTWPRPPRRHPRARPTPSSPTPRSSVPSPGPSPPSPRSRGGGRCPRPSRGPR